MKKLAACFVCASALLSLAEAHDTRPFIDPLLPSRLPTESPLDEHFLHFFRYEPLPASYTQALRRACRECAEVEFRYFFVDKPEFCQRLKRAELPVTLLPALQGVPVWYACSSPGVFIELGHVPSVSFYDVEGRELFHAVFQPAGNGYLCEGERYLTMWEFCRRHFLQKR